MFNLSPEFTALVASGNLLKADPNDVYRTLDSMNTPGNEPVHDTCRKFYEDEVAKSDFGTYELSQANIERRLSRRYKNMERALGVSQDKIMEALTELRLDGSSRRFDSLMLRYYAR